ncbi:hypothetical protein [Aquimarina brevivitae]|uniref:Lipoprotein n=1 Tax=Aquimarina brevivitae TaxID=323412 RepID=A0A4V2F4W1_9FLAO|nr:hypothetical protein [Aquimarina brevivitae]RZS90699.1 hypothetical protein EV197_3229 [Aquimarina brevivitae]
MKNLILMLIVILSASCGFNSSGDVKDFTEIQEELKDQFGENAYYSQLVIFHDPNMGTYFNASGTDKPSSLTLEEWNWMQGNWKQTSEITLEISGGKAEDFLFRLDKDISLPKLEELIAASVKKLKDEKNIDGVLHMASIFNPENGNNKELKYQITLKPQTGGTSFDFTYGLDGGLEDFDY